MNSKWFLFALFVLPVVASAGNGYLRSSSGPLPLLLTDVQVEIDGMIADVVVTQHFTNDTDVPIEALYVFPGSPKAAVYSAVLSVGERELVARIKETEQAKADYTQAIESGKTASLVEQAPDGHFSMRVGNILPGDDIRVTIRYTEPARPVAGEYRFELPLGNAAPESGFDFSMTLRSPIPIAAIDSPTHDIVTQALSEHEWRVVLADEELFKARRNVVIDYGLSQGEIASGLMAYEAEDATYFLLMGNAPADVASHFIPPREYMFILDVSGSMTGFPLEVTKRLVTGMLSRLRPSDRFHIIQFAGASASLYPEP